MKNFVKLSEVKFGDMKNFKGGIVSVYGITYPDYGINYPDYGVVYPDYGIEYPDYGIYYPDYGVKPLKD